MTEIIAKEGYLAFYKGLNTCLFCTVMAYALYFWWYRFFKRVWYDVLEHKELSQADIFATSSLAGIISTFMTHPMWFVNARMTLSKEKKGVFTTIADIYSKEGF